MNKTPRRTTMAAIAAPKASWAEFHSIVDGSVLPALGLDVRTPSVLAHLSGIASTGRPCADEPIRDPIELFIVAERDGDLYYPNFDPPRHS